eukprot:9024670-Alexandrium_andersonii.AAC.1
MSASLVGSEMCIRDSTRTSPGSGRPGHDRRASTAVSRCTSATPWGVGPVSYTHLTLPTICSV